MDPVTSVDQLVMLLQQRLMERARATTKGPSRKRKDQGADRLDSVKALAAVDGVEDHQLRRALVNMLLAETFGSELTNDAKFQQITDRVTTTLESEPSSAELLSQIVGELRAVAR